MSPKNYIIASPSASKFLIRCGKSEKKTSAHSTSLKSKIISFNTTLGVQYFLVLEGIEFPALGWQYYDSYYHGIDMPGVFPSALLCRLKGTKFKRKYIIN